MKWMFGAVSVELDDLATALAARLAGQGHAPARSVHADQFTGRKARIVQGGQMLPVEDILPDTRHAGLHQTLIGRRRRERGRTHAGPVTTGMSSKPPHSAHEPS